MIRGLLVLLFLGILTGMLAVTTHAMRDRSILAVGPELTADPWFQATLADAYFGFLTFYVWVAYKEPTWWRRVLWFVLIMTLGNIAMSLYMLWQLGKWNPQHGVRSLLERDTVSAPAITGTA
jgi:hypothetical protein